MTPPSRYTEAQKAAIVGARLDEGMTLADAVRKAAAGELDCPAFTVPYKTAHQWVTRAERDRAVVRAENDPLSHISDVAQRAYQAYVPRAEQVITAMNAGKCSEQRYRETMRSLQFTAQAIKAAQGRPAPKTSKGDPIETGKPRDVDISTLLSADEQNSPSVSTQTNDEEQRDTGPAHSDASTLAPAAALERT